MIKFATSKITITIVPSPAEGGKVGFSSTNLSSSIQNTVIESKTGRCTIYAKANDGYTFYRWERLDTGDNAFSEGITSGSVYDESKSMTFTAKFTKN